MRWSLRLGRIAGIDIYVHATFTLLIVWVALSHWLQSRNLGTTLEGIVFVLTLFLCVVLHELGHALMARRYGIRTHDITLLPIGGLARLEKMPDKPVQEFWVALAGPAVNVVIAIALFLGLAVRGSYWPIESFSLVQGSFLYRLMVVNIFLVLFNMLPAFPMDGGRVLRAFLASRMDYARATNIAATIGQGMALLFGFLGFFFNPILLFIAFFVWIGASQETGAAELRSGLTGVTVRETMMTDFTTLDPHDSLERAVDLILAGTQHDFPVVNRQSVQGILTRQDLMVALARQGRDTPVFKVMRQEVPSVSSHSLVLDVLALLQNQECQTVPVVDEGRLVGLLTSENVGEYLMIQSALKTPG